MLHEVRGGLAGGYAQQRALAGGVRPAEQLGDTGNRAGLAVLEFDERGATLDQRGLERGFDAVG